MGIILLTDILYLKNETKTLFKNVRFKFTFLQIKVMI